MIYAPRTHLTHKNFLDGAYLALIIWLSVLPLTLITQAYAPSLYVFLEGIGNYQYKPWIILAPTVCTLIIALVVMRGYRNLNVIAGAAVCSVGVIIAAMIAFLAVIMTLPRLTS